MTQLAKRASFDESIYFVLHCCDTGNRTKGMEEMAGSPHFRCAKAGRSHFVFHFVSSAVSQLLMIITGICIFVLCLEFVVVDHVPSRLNSIMTMH